MNSQTFVDTNVVPHAERDVMGRLIYAITLSGLFVYGIMAPASPAGQLYQDSAWIGKALIAAAGVLAVLIAGDTWMNDVQPPHVQLRWTSRYRHWLYAIGGLLYITAIYHALVKPIEQPGPVIAAVYMYSCLAAFGFALALRDVIRRPGHAASGT